MTRSRYSDAEKQYRQAYADYKNEYGDENTWPAQLANFEGVAYFHESRLMGARYFFEKPLDLFDICGAKVSPAYASTLNNLGAVELQLGDTAQGRAPLERAEAYFRRQAPDSLDLGTSRGRSGTGGQAHLVSIITK